MRLFTRSLLCLIRSLLHLPFPRCGGLSSPHISHFYTMVMFMIYGRYTVDNLFILTTYLDCILICYTSIYIYMWLYSMLFINKKNNNIVVWMCSCVYACGYIPPYVYLLQDVGNLFVYFKKSLCLVSSVCGLGVVCLYFPLFWRCAGVCLCNRA